MSPGMHTRYLIQHETTVSKCQGPAELCQYASKTGSINRGELKLGIWNTCGGDVQGRSNIAWRHWNCVTPDVLAAAAAAENLIGFQQLPPEDKARVVKAFDDGAVPTKQRELEMQQLLRKQHYAMQRTAQRAAQKEAATAVPREVTRERRAATKERVARAPGMHLPNSDNRTYVDQMPVAAAATPAAAALHKSNAHFRGATQSRSIADSRAHNVENAGATPAPPAAPAAPPATAARAAELQRLFMNLLEGRAAAAFAPQTTQTTAAASPVAPAAAVRPVKRESAGVLDLSDAQPSIPAVLPSSRPHASSAAHQAHEKQTHPLSTSGDEGTSAPPLPPPQPARAAAAAAVPGAPCAAAPGASAKGHAAVAGAAPAGPTGADGGLPRTHNAQHWPAMMKLLQQQQLLSQQQQPQAAPEPPPRRGGRVVKKKKRNDYYDDSDDEYNLDEPDKYEPRVHSRRTSSRPNSTGTTSSTGRGTGTGRPRGRPKKIKVMDLNSDISVTETNEQLKAVAQHFAGKAAAAAAPLSKAVSLPGHTPGISVSVEGPHKSVQSAAAAAPPPVKAMSVPGHRAGMSAPAPPAARLQLPPGAMPSASMTARLQGHSLSYAGRQQHVSNSSTAQPALAAIRESSFGAAGLQHGTALGAANSCSATPTLPLTTPFAYDKPATGNMTARGTAAVGTGLPGAQAANGSAATTAAAASTAAAGACSRSATPTLPRTTPFGIPLAAAAGGAVSGVPAAAVIAPTTQVAAQQPQSVQGPSSIAGNSATQAADASLAPGGGVLIAGVRGTEGAQCGTAGSSSALNPAQPSGNMLLGTEATTQGMISMGSTAAAAPIMGSMLLLPFLQQQGFQWQGMQMQQQFTARITDAAGDPPHLMAPMGSSAAPVKYSTQLHAPLQASSNMVLPSPSPIQQLQQQQHSSGLPLMLADAATPLPAALETALHPVPITNEVRAFTALLQPGSGFAAAAAGMPAVPAGHHFTASAVDQSGPDSLAGLTDQAGPNSLERLKSGPDSLAGFPSDRLPSWQGDAVFGGLQSAGSFDAAMIEAMHAEFEQAAAPASAVPAAASMAPLVAALSTAAVAPGHGSSGLPHITWPGGPAAAPAAVSVAQPSHVMQQYHDILAMMPPEVRASTERSVAQGSEGHFVRMYQENMARLKQENMARLKQGHGQQYQQQ